MKYLVLLAFLACASAASDDATAQIVNQVIDVGLDGKFTNKFETSNGIKVQEEGTQKGGGQKEEGIQEVSGSASWSLPDGTKVEMTYVANENGFQPQGTHVPAIPPAIARALEWIAAHPEKEERRN